ncbi:cytochrome-c peroxidase [Fimbriiglobus ruber]|uniref:Cytochrome c551 peroxidase n=1 Tax=Fimbriiglobus ruber TaxID=1908690 RepID=A0A225DFT3_9BACT|nr:cytochrome c peroxidase [Fimbriiglobus ruber]OWK40431.1 Cytochrome c551 peroxidase [Fimbriiglobus ruber]
MPTTRRFSSVAVPALAVGLFAFAWTASFAQDKPHDPPAGVKDPHDAAIPNDALKAPFKDTAPIIFVTRNQGAAEWAKLPAYWNETTEQATDPITGEKATRRAVKIKVPLGLGTFPTVPPRNAMTVAKWELGKRLYFDKILSTNNTVACASCHQPGKGYGDARKVSIGIANNLGGVNAPTVINSAYNQFQFWDGRAASLEEQAQGPVGNPLEMFAGKGDHWEEAVVRLRKSPEYVKAFRAVFGHGPTRDAASKAIAAYERTVLSGNSVHDRADLLMRKRVAEEESGKFDLKAEDYAAAVKAAFAAKDAPALTALGLDPAADADKAAAVGAKLVNGRTLFFGKARCSNCHVGDNFTDHAFHNLGVGAKDGSLPESEYGRWTRLPTGDKDETQVGAFKTPGLRALVGTGPYMHSGDEKTLEAVIDLYDRGGNANEFLDAKMRDTDAERAFLKAKADGTTYTGPKPTIFTRGGRPIIPFKLNLTAAEKADLVLFLKALEGDPIDPTVADPNWYPKN